MTQKEKAKAYDEVQNKLRRFIAQGVDPLITRADVQDFFPELAESEDERIRKSIIELLNEVHFTFKYYDINKMLAWLENQGKQKLPIEKLPFEMKTPEESLGIDSDTYSKIVDECVYGEQKPDDIKPKFKNGDRVKNKKSGVTQILGSCIEDIYEGAFPFRIKDQDEWELVEQKPTEQNKEDEKTIHLACEFIRHHSNHNDSIGGIDCSILIKRLKSLRLQNNITDEELAQAKKDAYNDALDKIEYHSGEPTFDDGWSAAIWYLKKKNAQFQNTWKPNDQQVLAIQTAIGVVGKYTYTGSYLQEVLEQVKKLREE